MTDLARWLLDPSGLTPHGFCLLWDPRLIWTHALANIAIGLAYFSIPLALVAFARRRHDLVFKPVFWLFAAFILLCGTGHWLDLLTLWVPVYGAEAVVKALTAAVSVVTAVALWPLLPRALGLPSPEQMRAGKKRLRDRFLHSPVAMHILDEQGMVMEVSDRWVEMTGYSREEAVGRFVGDFLEDGGDATRAEIAETFRVDFRRDVPRRFVHRDGTIIDTFVSMTIERPADGSAPHMLSAVIDVTARKRAEVALRESEARFRQMFVGAPAAMHSLDSTGCIVAVSERWAEFMGYQPEEVEGRHFTEFVTEVGAGMFRKHWPRFLATGVLDDARTQMVKRSGEVAEVEISARIFRDAAGTFVRSQSVVTDITARVRVEERLRQAQKMEAVGQLTGGIAHDFNNVLQAVTGNLELIKRRVRDERPDVARLAGNALTAAEKATGLTAQLLSFARRQRLDPQSLDPVEVVEGMRGLLTRTVGERITLHVTAEPGIGACLADRNQLESALLNLAINARDALDGAAGTLTVSVRGERVVAAAEGWPPDGEYICIAVQDDGPGMPEKVRCRVFEPFFTTKPPGKGTGLGLAQIHGFAHQSGGTVQIESTPGQGTKVAILLPRSGKAVRRCVEAVAPTPEPEAGFGETVLVVEDDTIVRAALAETLRDLRYCVIEAADADAALAILDGGVTVDLVVSDVMMPGSMDGVEFATVLAERIPALPVVLATGRADALGSRPLPSGVGLLSKPLSRAGIAAALRRALAEVREPIGA